MVRLGIVSVLSAVTMAALGAASAFGGAPAATLNCPDGFQLLPTSVLAGYSVGGIQSADLNGNQQTCIKFLNTPSDIVFIDDVVPKR